MIRGEKEEIEGFLATVEEEYKEMNEFLAHYDVEWEDQGYKEGVHMFTRR